MNASTSEPARDRANPGRTQLLERPVADLNLESKLRWLIAIRLLVIASVVVPYLLLHLTDGARSVEDEAAAALLLATTNESGAHAAAPGIARQQLQLEMEEIRASIEEKNRRERQLIGWLVAWVSIQTLLSISALRFLSKWLVGQAYLQFIGDLGLVTLSMYSLGEEAASLSTLYLIVIIVASVLLRRSAGLVIATIAFTCLSIVTLLPAVQSGMKLDIASIAAHQSSDNLAIHLLGFYAVAFLTSFLARDVTRVEAQLEEANLEMQYLQALHADIIQSMSTGLATLDLNHRITSLNRAGERILGAQTHLLLGEPISKTPLAEVEPWIENAATATESNPARLRSEVDCVRAEDQTIRIGFTLTQLRDGQGFQRGFILLFRDLSLWLKLEERVRLQDRMAAMGEMAAGLAHEVGNPLAAISGSVQMLASSLPQNLAHRKLVDIILKESRRLDRSVKDFLHFARPRDRHPVEFDIAQLLAEDVELLRNSNEVGENHTIELDLKPKSTIIVADQDQIAQVFWNLARNALQAMPNGGTLRVTGAVHEQYYRLTVGDTGSGMSDAEKSKLFQPYKSFFDGGTGIGMAIVYRIVEDHGGNIEVETAPDQGSLISVDFPLSASLADRNAEIESSGEGHELTSSLG